MLIAHPPCWTPLPAEGGAAGGSGRDSREGREKHRDAFPPSAQQPKQVRKPSQRKSRALLRKPAGCWDFCSAASWKKISGLALCLDESCR